MTRDGVPYAGLVTRTVAMALDALLLIAGILVAGTLVGLAISIAVPGDSHTHVGASVIAAAVGASTLLMALYLACFWTLAGQTPGMRAMGLRVEPLDGERVSPGRALTRLVGMVLAALPLMAGYLLILFDDRRQGLHDKLARTAVLYAVEPVTSQAAGPVAESAPSTRLFSS